jgi:hypothetical protein
MISSLYKVDYTLLEKKMLQMEECDKSKRRFLMRFRKCKCDSIINVNLFPQLPLQLLFDSYHGDKFDSNNTEGIRAFNYYQFIFCHLKERCEMSSTIGFNIITPIRNDLDRDW